MKRIFIVLAVISFVLVGCSEELDDQTREPTTDWEQTIYGTVNNLEGVTMIVKEGTVTSTGLTVTFENNYNKQIIYGEYYLLEKKIKGTWYQVPFAFDGNPAFNDIGYSLDSSVAKEWQVKWEGLYGSIDHGEYRIVKEMLDFRNAGGYDKYHLTAEFTVD